MALTSNDETDLLLPLYRGIEQTPRFATFLQRLRNRTGARHVSLSLDNEGRDTVTALVLTHAAAAGQRLRPFRAYTLNELSDDHEADPAHLVELDEEYGIKDARAVRIPVAEGRSAWLIVARQAECSATDSALLSSLAPYVQSVLEVSDAIQRERAAAGLSAQGLERLGAGWILFDSEARVVAIEPELRDRLHGVTGVRPTDGERLRAVAPAAGRYLAETANRYGAGGPQSVAQTVLTTAPRCEAVLYPVERESPAARQFPSSAMIAWCRFDRHATGERAAILAGLHDLPRREAELAVALADGLSINEAAHAMGLTVETARNYSKRLYSKLDVTGQAQLVRLVHRSSAVLA